LDQSSIMDDRQEVHSLNRSSSGSDDINVQDDFHTVDDDSEEKDSFIHVDKSTAVTNGDFNESNDDHAGKVSQEQQNSLTANDTINDPQVRIERPLTVEEFQRETMEMVAAVEQEMLETEAILNAPPGADSVEVENISIPTCVSVSSTNVNNVGNGDDAMTVIDEKNSMTSSGIILDDNNHNESSESIQASKNSSTKGKDEIHSSNNGNGIDTQEVYEAAKERLVQTEVERMTTSLTAGSPLPSTDLAKKAEEIVEKAEEEKLETEAIMGAPPGADSVDFCDPSDDDCILELRSRLDTSNSVNGGGSNDSVPTHTSEDIDELKDFMMKKQNTISDNEIDLLGLDDDSIEVDKDEFSSLDEEDENNENAFLEQDDDGIDDMLITDEIGLHNEDNDRISPSLREK